MLNCSIQPLVCQLTILDSSAYYIGQFNLLYWEVQLTILNSSTYHTGGVSITTWLTNLLYELGIMCMLGLKQPKQHPVDLADDLAEVLFILGELVFIAVHDQ